MCLQSIWTHQETQVWGFGAGWTGNVGVRSGSVRSFPAGRNNPAVVCCHGTSTKAFVLRWSSQQNRVAHETVDLTRPLFFSKIYCYLWVLFFNPKIYTLSCLGGLERYWTTLGNEAKLHLMWKEHSRIPGGTGFQKRPTFPRMQQKQGFDSKIHI